jgi:tetratricopeptide (TPR) repeat protein
MGTLRWPPRGDWDEKAVPTHRGDDTFLSILPFLLFSKRGGSPITEAIGFWLRRLGAEGFVYPSARNDFGVTLRDGTMVQSEGWNFVDYRNLALPETDRWLIEEPDSWSELVNYEEYQVAFNRPHSGSWRLVGREAATLQAYSAAQDALYQKLLTVPQGIWKRAKDSRDRALSTRSPARNQDPLESLVTRYHDRNYKLSRDGVQDLIGREKLNESMTGSPRAYRAFYLLGLAEAKLGDHERAVNAFEKAAKIDSTKSEPLANMGNSLKVLGRYDEAVVAYQAALRLNPLDNVAAGNMPAAIMMATTLRNDARQEVKKNNEGGQLAK